VAEQKIEPYFDLHCQPLCKACSGETRSMNVYLMDGTLLKIGNAGRVTVTDDAIVIDCVAEGAGHAVKFRREDVYFTTCEMCLPPPAG
jgi:hypothetical protein